MLRVPLLQVLSPVQMLFILLCREGSAKLLLDRIMAFDRYRSFKTDGGFQHFSSKAGKIKHYSPTELLLPKVLFVNCSFMRFELQVVLLLTMLIFDNIENDLDKSLLIMKTKA